MTEKVKRVDYFQTDDGAALIKKEKTPQYFFSTSYSEDGGITWTQPERHYFLKEV